MKKIICLLLTLILCCSTAVACSEKTDVPPTGNTHEVTAKAETTKPETTEVTYSEEYLKEHLKKVTVALDTNGCDFDKDFNVEFWENYGEKLKIALNKDNDYTAVLPVKMDATYLLVWHFDDMENYHVDYSNAEIKATDMAVSFKITELPPAPTAEELEKQGADVAKEFFEAVEPLQSEENAESKQWKEQLQRLMGGSGSDEFSNEEVRESYAKNYVDNSTMNGKPIITREEWANMGTFERENYAMLFSNPKSELERSGTTSKETFYAFFDYMFGNSEIDKKYKEEVRKVWEFHWYVWENRARTGIPYVDVWSAYKKYYGEIEN